MHRIVSILMLVAASALAGEFQVDRIILGDTDITNYFGGGGGSGFPLTADGDLAGYKLTNGFFVGDGSGLTNLTGIPTTNGFASTGYVANAVAGIDVETNRLAFYGESNIVIRADGTNIYWAVLTATRRWLRHRTF